MSHYDSTINCPNCNSVYGLKKYAAITRDKDSIDCSVCGHKDIYSWNEAKIWTATLIKDATKKQNQDTTTR